MAWLHVPLTFCHSAPASQASTSGCVLPPTMPPEWSVWSNGRRIAPASWRRACKRGILSPHLSGMTLPPLTLQRGVDALISSLQDTRASLSATPGGDKARPTRATFGHLSPHTSGQYSLPLFSARTCQAIYPWGSSRSAATYKRWVTALRQDYLARRKAALCIFDSDCSLLPTPTVTAYGSMSQSSKLQGGPRLSLNSMATRGRWPTPIAHDAHAGAAHRALRGSAKAGCSNLNDTVLLRMWPTPMAEDGEGGPAKGNLTRKSPPLRAAVHMTKDALAQPSTQTGQLSPIWTELLMGLPKNWTALGLTIGIMACRGS